MARARRRRAGEKKEIAGYAPHRAERLVGATAASPETKERAGARAAWLASVALLVAATLVAYSNSFSVPFLFDDIFEIVRNPFVKEFQSPLYYLTRSRGIPTLTLALNYRWGGDASTYAYHVVNVLVHAVNGVLVYFLVREILALPPLRDRYLKRRGALALFVALIFVAHPLQTMAASYIVQRAESIASLFYLVTLLAFVRGMRAESPRRQSLLLVVCVGAVFLGVLSKEIVATAPVMVLLLHLCFFAGAGLNRIWRRAAAALLALPLAFALALSWEYLGGTFGSGAPDALKSWESIPSAGFELEDVTPWQYLFTQFGVILWYLRLFLLPTALCFDYGWPFVDSFWRADVIVPLLALLALVAAGVACFRRYRIATLAIAWFFVVLAPSSSIVPLRDAAFEHRMYLALVGPALLLVVGGHDLIVWATRAREAAQRRMWLEFGGFVLSLYVTFLGGLTLARNEVLRDKARLAEDTVKKAPGNWRARFEYATSLEAQGRGDEARRELEMAVALDTSNRHGQARVHLGGIYLRAGRLREAEEVLLPATRGTERSIVAAAYLNLGTVYLAMGRWDEAGDALDQSARLMPGWATTHAQLAIASARTNRWTRAEFHYQAATTMKPAYTESLRRQLAEIAVAQGVRLNATGSIGALHAFEFAIRMAPNLARGHEGLAAVLARQGEWEKAGEELQAAFRLAPLDRRIQDNMDRVARREVPVLE